MSNITFDIKCIRADPQAGICEQPAPSGISTVTVLPGVDITIDTGVCAPKTVVEILPSAMLVPATNVDMVVAPRGTGAFSLAVPTPGSAVGGNCRGDNAVDLQMVRGGATEVASGVQSFIGGGSSNTAGGLNSGVVGGLNNNISGTNTLAQNVICGGQDNVITAIVNAMSDGTINNFIGAGNGNQIEQTSAGILQFSHVICGGESNTITDGRKCAIVGGESNTINVPAGAGGVNSDRGYSIIGGGSTNSIVQASNAVIGGGVQNSITAVTPFLVSYSFIGGGELNAITGDVLYSAIVGGSANTISDNFSVIGGGSSNTIAVGATNSFIGGGSSNTASANQSTIGGGASNIASGTQSTIGGGLGNQASNAFATVGGGNANVASGPGYPTIAGGNQNMATAQGSTIGGGSQNIASGLHSTVGGGSTNDASGPQATIGGGSDNIASGETSIASGFQADAYNDYQDAFASGRTPALTHAQVSRYMLRTQIAAGTPGTVSLGRGTPINLLISLIRVGAYLVEVHAVATDTTTGLLGATVLQNFLVTSTGVALTVTTTGAPYPITTTFGVTLAVAPITLLTAGTDITVQATNTLGSVRWAAFVQITECTA